jgi:hypothetical protein
LVRIDPSFLQFEYYCLLGFFNIPSICVEAVDS